MKIIKFQNKVNDYQYFINETELVNHLKNVVFKNEPDALINTSTGKELSNDYLINESFDIGESEYVDADLEYLDYRILGESEKWLEKKTGKMLIVPVEIIRHFDIAASYVEDWDFHKKKWIDKTK